MKKLNINKVIFSNDRIRYNDKSIYSSQLHALCNTYIGIVRELRNIPSINFNQIEFNKSIHFKLFGIEVTVNELFELHNISAKSQGLKIFDEINYDPNNSIKFSPITKNER